MRRKNLEVYQAAVKLAREKRAHHQTSQIASDLSARER
jgi:hypothetical protein